MADPLQDRAVSMILMVPNITASPVLSSSSSGMITNDEQNIPQSLNMNLMTRMPIYRGSIVRIQQHTDNKNTSDFIIRVPNFQNLPLQSNNIDNNQQIRIKRRAPLCPVLSSSNQLTTHVVNKLNQSQTRSTSKNRLSMGLRGLSRTFIFGCKFKRSSSINEINILPSLPDIEVMKETITTPIASRKSIKYRNATPSTPKLMTPKMLFIKRKNLDLNNRQTLPSSVSIGTQVEHENTHINTIPTPTLITTHYTDVDKDNFSKRTSFLEPFDEENDLSQQNNVIEDDHNKEQQNKSIEFNQEVEQHLAAIAQLVSDIPISSIDADSLSTHRYSTISATLPEKHNSLIENDTDERSFSEQLISMFFPASTEISHNFDDTTKPSTIHEDSSKFHRPFRIQTSILQPDISVIRIGTKESTHEISHSRPEEKLFHQDTDSVPRSEINIELKKTDDNQIKEDLDSANDADEETFAECYEVTYQIDPQSQLMTNQSVVPIPINPDSFDEPDLTSTLTTWLPSTTQNGCERVALDSNSCEDAQKYQQVKKRKYSVEQLKADTNEPQMSVNNIRRIKFHSLDDLSRTSNDQTSTYQSESIYASSSSEGSSRHCTIQRSTSYDCLGISVSSEMETYREHLIHHVEELSSGEQAELKENDRNLCIDSTPVIDEDYTVVLQLIHHGVEANTLDYDVITNNAYEEFKAHINELHP